MLFPNPSRSHLVVAQALTTELAKKGHQITEFSAFPLEKYVKNYRSIGVPFKQDNDNGEIKFNEV